jgi:hypothetical protein
MKTGALRSEVLHRATKSVISTAWAIGTGMWSGVALSG